MVYSLQRALPEREDMKNRVGIGLIILSLVAGFALAQTPKYKNFAAPFPQMGGDGAEPSIGVNWNTGNVLFQSGLETLKIEFNDTTNPTTASWTNISSFLTSIFSLDPVLFTDRKTGRTFVSQLDAGCSITTYSDNDGGGWNLSIGCGIPAGLDHQSVGGGAYAFPAPLRFSPYPNNVYYCSQNLASAICSRSDNGGLTFGLGIPVYTILSCSGRHGKLRVAQDGTAYLPNSSCGSEQAVAVSQNNGNSWTVRPVPGTTSGISDPAVAIGANGTLYFAYQNGDGHARVSVSKDRGATWIYNKDVGASLGIKNIVFPAAVSGDNSRAAVAFLGTTTAGNYQDPNFTGKWYLYVSTTFDGGNTWTTVNATPNDPVQFGSIYLQDGVEPARRSITTNMSTPDVLRDDRNLLDFIDITMDKQGRAIVAYADGCIGSCVTNPVSDSSRSALATVARQSSGKRLLAAYD